MKPIAAPRRGVHFDAPPPLSLYLHFPWCARKCPYCDFNSHEVRGGIPEREYLAALETELQAALPEVWGRRIETVFIGGGTPSLLSGDGLERLLAMVRTLLPLTAMAEITLEANPGTVDAGNFAAYRSAGVNRLSLGIQSFDPDQLQALGRIHGSEEARRAIELAQRHFDRINLDLMYGLPRQTPEQALADLETALACGVEHLSCYQLTLEPNTPFHRHPPPLPPDDSVAEIGEAIVARLAEAGYHRYETSAFARVGAECRHNLNYWTFGDYLGLGPGAHGKLSLRSEVARHARLRHPRAWLEALQSGADSTQVKAAVAIADLPFEFAMNAFRLIDGFALDLFEVRSGLPLAVLLPTLDALERRGLVARAPGRVAPTPLGARFLNELLQAFLPDA